MNKKSTKDLGGKDRRGLADCPVFGVYRVSRVFMRVYSFYLEEVGLTYTQYLAMLYLWENGRGSVDELGEVLGLDSGTLTPLLKRLEGKGLVFRNRDPGDERRMIITLTSEGVALEERVKVIQGKVVEHFGLDPEHVADMNNAVKRVLEMVGKEKKIKLTKKLNLG